jgi:hypothetical protein
VIVHEYQVSFYYESELSFEYHVEKVKSFALQKQGLDTKQLFDWLIFFDLDRVLQPVEIISKIFLEVLY